jgi:hypothetical protein
MRKLWYHHGDVYGDHSVVCMHGPARYKIHNAIRDTTVRVCQEALLSPIVEPELPGGGRGDVLLRFPGPAGNRSLVVVDFAMTTIATRPRAALAAPGGAATRYEQTKREKYQTHSDEMGAELVPVIVDEAGAWGESALAFHPPLCPTIRPRHVEGICGGDGGRQLGHDDCGGASYPQLCDSASELHAVSTLLVPHVLDSKLFLFIQSSCLFPLRF